MSVRKGTAKRGTAASSEDTRENTFPTSALGTHLDSIERMITATEVPNKPTAEPKK